MAYLEHIWGFLFYRYSGLERCILAELRFRAVRVPVARVEYAYCIEEFVALLRCSVSGLVLIDIICTNVLLT